MDKDFFTPEEKVDNFDKIAELFYERNFGSLSKSDMELLMFKFYLDKLEKSDDPGDGGAIDYNRCSDYKISRKLGITQQRVRNLKVKRQLVYAQGEYDWKTPLAGLTKNARYDSVTKKVTINIPDPNLYLEIQNYLEENGGYIETQLNSKLLVIRAEYFIQLVVMLEDAESQKKVIRELKKQLKGNNYDGVFDEKHIGKSLMDTAVNISTVAANLSSLLSPENVLGMALMELLKQHSA